MPGCSAARLLRCQAATLPGCYAARLLRCWAAGLLGCAGAHVVLVSSTSERTEPLSRACTVPSLPVCMHVCMHAYACTHMYTRESLSRACPVPSLPMLGLGSGLGLRIRARVRARARARVQGLSCAVLACVVSSLHIGSREGALLA